VRGNSGNPGQAGLLLFAGLPLGDAFAAIVRRIRSRRSPFLGDRCHFYDLLQARGWRIESILAFSFFLTAALVLAGLLSIRGAISATALLTAEVGLITVGGYFLGSFDPEAPAKESKKRIFHAPQAQSESHTFDLNPRALDIHQER
jgi:hypothetical protein